MRRSEHPSLGYDLGEEAAIARLERTIQELADELREMRAGSISQLVDATVIECAEEMMRSRSRYVDGVVEGARFEYRRKQAGYLRSLASSPLIGMGMKALTPGAMADWFIASYMRNHAEGTAARFRAWLVQVGAWGVRSRYWNENLFELLPSASQRPKAQAIYSLEEIDRLWIAAESPRERAMLVMLRCGLRQGECLALSEEQIMNDETLLVRYTLSREENRWGDTTAVGHKPASISYLGRPKTAGSMAKVHIPRRWMEHLKESLRQAEPCKIRAFDDQDKGPNPRRFVLPNYRGEFWIEWCAAECMRKLMSRANVAPPESGQTFHAWRHAFCSDLAALGCNDVELAFLMRHSDVNLSKSVYASARQASLHLYKAAAQSVSSIEGLVDAIADLDESRRQR